MGVGGLVAQLVELFVVLFLGVFLLLVMMMMVFCLVGWLVLVLRQDSLWNLESTGSWNTVDQAGLPHREAPASTFQVLGLKSCNTRPSFCFCFLFFQTVSHHIILAGLELDM